MKEELIERWVERIRDLSPLNAEFHRFNKDGFGFIDIDWQLNNDPKRPAKPSRLFRVKFSREALEDYRHGHDTVKEIRDQRLRDKIAEEILNFDPNHNEPFGEQPVLEVFISTKFLNAPCIACDSGECKAKVSDKRRGSERLFRSTAKPTQVFKRMPDAIRQSAIREMNGKRVESPIPTRCPLRSV